MPFDPRLAERVRSMVAGIGGFSEKKMFGGLAFMLGDKMCCGVLEDKLVARIGQDHYESALRKSHVSPMDFTGRPLKGYVYIDSQGLKSAARLRYWIQQSIMFTSTLVHGKSGRKRKTISEVSPGENAREMPISKLVNFGPVTRPEFKAMGLTTFGQLEDLGWEAVCRKWVEHFPERLNANAFIGIIATLEGISWTKASASDRAKARGLVNELKQEYGLPVAVPRSKLKSSFRRRSMSPPKKP